MLPLCQGEQILAVGHRLDGGHAVIATDRAIHYLGDTAGWSRLGWELITGVEWDGIASCLVITGLAGCAPSRTVLSLRRRGALRELAAERIAHTWLGCWTVTLADRRRVSVELRRRPRTDELLWAVVSADGAGCAGTEPDVRAQVDRAVAGLAGHLGLEYPAGPDQGIAGTGHRDDQPRAAVSRSERTADAGSSAP
jgi:hypothetical protein